MFVFFVQKYLEEEVSKYKDILRKTKDYDENISKDQIVKAFAEKERRRLEENLAEKEKQEETLQRKMDMLEKRQEKELKLIKEQARTSREDLEKQMQLMKEADMKAQMNLQKQLDQARKNEKQASKDLEDLKQFFEGSWDYAQAELKASNLRFEQMKEDSMKAEADFKSQLSAISLRETENKTYLSELKNMLMEERKESAAIKKYIKSLEDKLKEANEPGYIRWIWRKIF